MGFGDLLFTVSLKKRRRLGCQPIYAVKKPTGKVNSLSKLGRRSIMERRAGIGNAVFIAGSALEQLLESVS
jgi:hypothetical protein